MSRDGYVDSGTRFRRLGVDFPLIRAIPEKIRKLGAVDFPAGLSSSTIIGIVSADLPEMLIAVINSVI